MKHLCHVFALSFMPNPSNGLAHNGARGRSFNGHKCSDCLTKFSVRHGSTFDDNKIKLQNWFKAIYLITSHKKSISNCQLARAIKVTQKTAWFMPHRILNASETTGFKALGGKKMLHCNIKGL